jgi:hypothetical protein
MVESTAVSAALRAVRVSVTTTTCLGEIRSTPWYARKPRTWIQGKWSDGPLSALRQESERQPMPLCDMIESFDPMGGGCLYSPNTQKHCNKVETKCFFLTRGI